MKNLFPVSVLLAYVIGVESFAGSFDRRHSRSSPSLSSLRASLSLPTPPVSAKPVESSASLEIRRYNYDGWNLTYRYKAASPGFENASPILLIHPVGIGLCSWFWEKFMEQWTDGPAIYAPNLIGCGISEGGDAWDPEERGLSFPFAWVEGCEALMKSVTSSPPSSPLSAFSFLTGNSKNRKWTVMSQGGLATVAVMMAARNPDMIDHLVLASPPSWKSMTTPVPTDELSRNYNFLRNPIWGGIAFQVLESRGAIEFFSNQFLFSRKCDAKWLENTQYELGVKARPPVISFNAGFCQHRSYEQELRELSQSTLILAGDGDKRPKVDYQRHMKDCRLNLLPGMNVLPWESPIETADALKLFLGMIE